MTTRTLAPGVVVSPLSLGGALLGAADAAEAAAILRVAVASGVALVDTSSAYGASEQRIGESPHDSLVVATKFGNPCELNGHTHDYSVGGCAAACFNSLTLLRGKRIAALQLHSPPEQPSPLSSPELLHLETRCWTHCSTRNAPPPPRGNPSLVYSARRHLAVLYGGWDGTRRLDDVWCLDMESWRWHRAATTAPPPSVKEQSTVALVVQTEASRHRFKRER